MNTEEYRARLLDKMKEKGAQQQVALTFPQPVQARRSIGGFREIGERKPCNCRQNSQPEITPGNDTENISDKPPIPG